MITRDKDESELEDEGGDNLFRRGRDGERNGLRDSGSSGVEVQMVVPGGAAPYGKIRREDKAEPARKGKDASVRLDVERYSRKEARPAQRLFTGNLFEEVAPIQGGNKAHVKKEQMGSMNFKARKVVGGGEEKKRLPEGAYGYVGDGKGASGRGVSGRGQNGVVSRGGAIDGAINRGEVVNRGEAAHRSGQPNGGAPEDVIVLRDDESGDSPGGRKNFSTEGLYPFEDKERKNSQMMKKGFHKMINDNIINKLVHKTFNNIMHKTPNESAVVSSPDAAALGSASQNSGSHKRSAPLFEDSTVKKEKKKKMKRAGEEAVLNGGGGADCGGVRGKAGNQVKVRMKKEPRGRAAKEGEAAKEREAPKERETPKEREPAEPPRKDNFHLYCQNHKKIFGDADGGDLLKSESGGMMGSTREAPRSSDPLSGDTGNDRIQPMDSTPLGEQKNEENLKNQLSEISNIIYSQNGDDGNPVGGKSQEGATDEEKKMTYPSIYKEDKKEWFRANKQDEWVVHKLCDWLYNVKDKLYFNIKTQGIYYVKDGSFRKFESSFDERGDATLSRSGSGSGSGSGGGSQLGSGSGSQLGNSLWNAHKNGFPFEFDSDDPLLSKKGKAISADGRNIFANASDVLSDHSVRANPCVFVEDSGSMGGNNSSRVISRSSSGGRGAEADSGSSILMGKKAEQRNGGPVSGSPSNGSAARDSHSGGSGSADSRSADSRSAESRSAESRSPESRSPDNRSTDGRPGRESAEANDETVEEFSMVLEDDLVCGTYSQMGDHNRCENEDFYVTKDILDLNNVSESDGLCFFSGVFDGHGGSNCARYVMTHLKTNLIAKFRQSFPITCKKQCKDKESKLNDLSVEIRALYDSCIKGFDMTDKNYIELSKKYDYKDGSTACIVLIYGPDDDGSLKVLCANCGDSGALICHDRKPVKLSLRHKPDLQEERVRILKCGGIIANINGINRIITKHKVKGQTGREKTFLALSTSRSFGDISYKVPRKIVLCKPFISVYTIDFDMDSFLVLATDGILNVLTDKEIIDIVWRNIHRKPEEAAEEVVQEASRRGSTDDKTCTVIFFYWRKDIFRGDSEDASVDAPPREEAPGEDINMFSEVF
ncbi:protein phosphatase PPM4, putative [Plasmodium vivax]|uniref:Protein phosphatase PPM4, putative n=1 Tax=Plasmodium vivax TaxID=5855 RepID=A0A1G4HLL4_PLAVI|nr:protein phosphatase PPM4, putative [Plasmodium vivax]